jgi:hypothetical protein
MLQTPHATVSAALLSQNTWLTRSELWCCMAHLLLLQTFVILDPENSINFTPSFHVMP